MASYKYDTLDEGDQSRELMLSDDQEKLSSQGDDETEYEWEYENEPDIKEMDKPAVKSIKNGMLATHALEAVLVVLSLMCFPVEFAVFSSLLFGAALVTRMVLQHVFGVSPDKQGQKGEQGMQFLISNIALTLYFIPVSLFAFMSDWCLWNFCKHSSYVKAMKTRSDGVQLNYTGYTVNCTTAHWHAAQNHTRFEGFVALSKIQDKLPVIVLGSQTIINQLIRYGIPLLFGYIMVKGLMRRALDEQDDSDVTKARTPEETDRKKKEYQKNVQLFMLDFTDNLGLCTLLFDFTAHAFFQANPMWFHVKQVTMLVVAFALTFEIFVGLILLRQHENQGVSETRLSRHLEEGNNDTYWLQMVSLIFVNLPLGLLRLYWRWCGVRVPGLYLIKNFVCCTYAVTYILAPHISVCKTLKHSLSQALSALPGASDAAMEVQKQKLAANDATTWTPADDA